MYSCGVCGQANPDGYSCRACGSEQPATSVIRYSDDRLTSTIRTSGDEVGMSETITDRFFDVEGRIAQEHIEERRWIIPVTRVPAAATRAVAYPSFQQRPLAQPIQAGQIDWSDVNALLAGKT